MAQAELASTTLFNDSSLVSYWKLEDLNDSKSSNTLVNHNSVAFNPAKFNNGGDAGASNSNKYLSFGGNMGIAGNGDFSVSFWVKLNTEITSGIWELFEFNSTLTADRYIFAYYEYNGGTRRIVLQAANGSAVNYNITLGTTNFYHITITRNIASNEAILYVDAVAQGTGTISTGTTFSAQNNINFLANGTGGNLASAIIDDIAVFNRVLTPTEVALIFNGPSIKSEAYSFFI